MLKISMNRTQLDNHLLSKTYLEDIHDNVNPKMILNASTDFEDAVNTSVQSRFIPWDYDRSYFWDFNYEDCLFKTGIRIVDTPDYSNPWVVSYESITGSDSSWGYFIDSTGGLDSLIISSENFDLYFIYQIFADGSCGFASAPSLDPCNNNGVCEPQQGETKDNCDDCKNEVKNTGEKDLSIEFIRFTEDKKMFDEAWGNGKYEITCQWYISQGTTGLITSERDGEDPLLYNKWKRNEVPITRSARRGSKGSVTEKTINGEKEMYHKFDPTTDDIYMIITEVDTYGESKDVFMKDYFSGSNITWASTLKFDATMFRKTKGGTFHEGSSNGNISDGVFVIPAGSTWTAQTIGGVSYMVYEFDSPGQSEAHVKLKYR